MVTEFTREDEQKRPVKVEIWRDDKTGELVRIKRITYLTLGDEEIKLRADFYQESDPEGFKAALAEEIACLVVYQEIMRDLLLSPEKWAEKMKPPFYRGWEESNERKETESKIQKQDAE